MYTSDTAGVVQERLRIDEGGNVGIGTSTPARKLDVNGSSRITGDSGSTALQLQPAANTWGMTVDGTTTASQSYGLRINAGTNSSDTPLQIKDATQANDLMTILGNGNVGVGTSNPAYKLDVAGDVGVGNDLMLSRTTNSQGFIVRPNVSGYKNLWFAVSGGSDLDTFNVYSSNSYFTGNVGIGTAAPVAKLDVNGGIRAGDSAVANAYTLIHANSGGWYISLWWTNAGKSWYIQYDNSNNFYFANAYGNTIFQSWNVWIGTDTPSAKLDVAGNLFFSAANPSINFNSGGPTINVPSASTLAFSTSGSEKMRIQPDGNIGFLTTSPRWSVDMKWPELFVWSDISGSSDQRVEIGNGTVASHNSYIDLVWDTTYVDYGLRLIRSAGANGGAGIINRGTGPLDITNQDAASIRFYTNNLQRINIGTTGTLTLNAYGAGTLTTDASGNVTSSSDERLKDIKWNFTRGLSDIIKITPITYKWNKESGLDQIEEYSWFSAQNMQKAIPEAVWTDDRGYLSLSDRPILATIVNAVKELYNRLTSNDEDIATLKKVIELQQKQIDYLMSKVN
jgi:hypothetical protein